MKASALTVGAIVAVLSSGCADKREPRPAEGSGQATAHKAQVATEQAAGHDDEGCDEHGRTATRPLAGEPTRTQTPGGEAAVRFGEPFSDAPQVTVEQLLAKPDAYEGKRVAVTGPVTALCYHQRGWFAIGSDGGAGEHLRVITMPVFRVPKDAMGKQARAEGNVQVTEISAGFARHLAKEHKMGEAGPARGKVKRVVLRASAAEFTGGDEQ